MISDDQCAICRTALDLVARQPVDDHYEVLFFKCSLCGKTERVVATSDGAQVPQEPDR
jgi:hypothetical protein